jgi:hypothetical protein
MDNVYFSQFEHTYHELTRSGKAPWTREGDVERGPAYNPYSGVQYKGINGVMLDMNAASRGFHDPRWISLHEAEKFGLTLRRGEQPAPAAYTHSIVSRNSYYLLCNLEQFREYSRIPGRDIEREREIGREKLQAALDRSGAAGFTGVTDKLDKETERGQGSPIMRVIARYRLAQECGEYYIPPAVGEAGAVKDQAALIRSVYHAEIVKDKLTARSGDERDRATQRASHEVISRTNKELQVKSLGERSGYDR